jgi:membrane protein YdbS with pleckstrin-like domain
MLYAALKGPLLALLRAPTEPPEAPAGSHASVRVFRASPRYLSYRLLVLRLLTAGLVVVAAVLALAGALEGQGGLLGVGVLVALVGLPVMVLAGLAVRIDYDLRHYVVTDRSLRVREGAWTVKEMTITYANVQNLRVVQGPLMRLFGFWNLRVDVAGGGVVRNKPGQEEGGHHVVVAGIEDAHALRDQVLAHLRAARAGAGLGDLDDERAGADGRAGLLSPAALTALERVATAASALARAAAARTDPHGG